MKKKNDKGTLKTVVNVLTGKRVTVININEFIAVWDKYDGGSGNMIHGCYDECRQRGSSVLIHNGNLWLFGIIKPPKHLNVPKHMQCDGGEFVVLRCYEGMTDDEDKLEAEYALTE